ncbi:MAG: chitobiase/beta-hexosaminidase C-terminal domain-containing protein, partial [bacterium]
MDGSAPNQSSLLYTDPIVVNDAIFIKAIAYKTGFPHSAVTSSSYVISQVVAPVFDPEAGNLLAGAEISLSSTTADAVIYYTSDGTDPSCDGSGTSTQYTAPLSDNTEGTYTYKAIACKTNYLDSTISTSIYAVSMVGVVNTPTFSQLAATYTETQLVSISSSTEGAVIRYTDDGSVPTCSTGTIYSTAISIANPGLTLKAIACKINWTNSSVATASYTITGTVAAPTFNLVAGTYTSTQSVTISSATSGAVIHYTIDGS